jgi:hypothetical protein
LSSPSAFGKRYFLFAPRKGAFVKVVGGHKNI